MNIQEKINKKKRKLRAIKQILSEEVIYSQLKYLEYSAKEMELENAIDQLEYIANNKPNKEWIDVGNGWKKRKYKTD